MDPDTVDMEVAINLIAGTSAEEAELRAHLPLLNTLPLHSPYSQQRSIFSYQCNLILLIGGRPSPHSDSNLFRMFMGGHGIFRPRLQLMKVRPPTYCPTYLYPRFSTRFSYLTTFPAVTGITTNSICFKKLTTQSGPSVGNPQSKRARWLPTTYGVTQVRLPTQYL